jgi:hypothetical protein
MNLSSSMKNIFGYLPKICAKDTNGKAALFYNFSLKNYFNYTYMEIKNFKVSVLQGKY